MNINFLDDILGWTNSVGYTRFREDSRVIVTKNLHFLVSGLLRDLFPVHRRLDECLLGNQSVEANVDVDAREFSFGFDKRLIHSS